MKQKTAFSPPAIGGSSLLVIFTVLCMTVFALLSLSTSLAQQRLADASIQAVTAYYEADLQAEEILARLRNGELPAGVEESGGIFRYTCPITRNQWLMVEVRRRSDGWQVLRWQAVALPEAADPTLPVWDGY